MIRIVSFNVGLLDWLWGRIRPTPHVEERLAALPAALRETDADVLALQEIYDERHRRFLSSALRSSFPSVAYVRAGRAWGLENGLMILSRHPLEGRLVLFESAPFDERLLDHKGALVSKIKLAHCELMLINVHTTAGGVLSHPEHPRVDVIRARQLQQIFRVCASVSDGPILIAGDMNAGPGVSDANYRLFEQNGYVDIFQSLNGDKSDCTWDPTNVLNARGPHRTSPPQRIDHIFARSHDVASGRTRLLSSQIILKDRRVALSDGTMVSVSDHYGLTADLEIDGAT